MSWFVQSLNETESAKARCYPFLAVDMDFSSGHQRYWTGIGTITILNNTYQGVGELGKVSNPTEHVRYVAEKKQYSLSMAAIDISILSEADIEASFGRTVTEYLGFLDADTLQMIATPEINWEGTIGTIRRVDGPEPTVEITAEHILGIQDQADGWRYTREHQQLFFPNDTGFDQMPSLNTKSVMWGGYFVFPGTAVIGSGSGPRNRRSR